MAYVPLGDLIKPAKKEKAGERDLPVLSITMADGLVLQQEKFTKSVASRNLSNYTVVNRGQLVVGFPIDEAVLDFLQIADQGIVSPAYGLWDIKDPDRVDLNYLRKFLRSEMAISYYKLRLRGTTARRRSLTRDAFEALPVPLPPLPEQRRIAKILDKSSTQLRTARESASAIDRSRAELFASLFKLEDYPSTTVGELLSETSYGSSKKASSEGHFPILRMGNLSTTGSIDYSDLKYLDLEEKDVEKHTLKTGDILFNRTNSRELVGKTAVYYGENNSVAYAGYLVRCRTNETAVPEFISGYLNSHYGKAYLLQRAKNIVGMSNINAQELRSLTIPSVSLEDQSRYASIYKLLVDLFEVATRKVAALEELHASLSARAFAGKL